MTTSLLITTFNRSNLLQLSLERLTQLTIPDEVLIVDDGGQDNCEVVVNSFKGRLPIRYIYNHSPNWTICSFARNIGIKNTDKDVIITSEPEILFVTDVIDQIKSDMKQYPDQLISAGTIYHAQPNCFLSNAFATDPVQSLKDSIVEEYQIQPRSYHPNGFCKTTNMQATFIAAYKRDWLMELGGWDEQFPGSYGFDDIELCTRLRINGVNQFIDQNIEAIHQYHDHLPPHIQGPMVAANDVYFASKKLNEVEADIFEQKQLNKYKETDPRLIANKDREWGVIKIR